MRATGFMALILTLIISSGAYAAENARKVTVTGKSEITVPAQFAIIHFEVRDVQKEMNRSYAAVTRIISSLAGDLRNFGLKDSDLRRSLVLQGAEYAWEKDSRVLKGYYSECLLELTVNDIRRMSDVYKTLAEYKNISIGITEFKRNDEFELRQAEFKKALLLAEKKAKSMAGTLGAKLGRVYSIQEMSERSYDKVIYANAYSSKGDLAAADKIGYGNIEISGVVTVEFELK